MILGSFFRGNVSFLGFGIKVFFWVIVFGIGILYIYRYILVYIGFWLGYVRFELGERL